MKTKNNISKIATDMSWLQLTWSAWFLSIVFVLYIALRMIGGDTTITHKSFLTFSYQPAKIYMLVIGIISVSGFLTFYVKQGVSRKDYFFGGSISAIIVSLMIMIIAGIVALVENFFVPAIETGSFLGPEASWVLIIAVYSLNILVYYVAGWLIGAGFYRFGAAGILYIIQAIILVVISDIFWQFELKNPLKKLITIHSQWEFSFSLSVIGTFVLLSIALWIIRSTTKRVRIKLK
ncbi:MAG: hypothetical protein ABF649_13080 [Bacillus sp. (in: firmicutes)]